MGTSCTFIPKVTNSKGEKVNSNLAIDCISYIGNRKDGIDVYARIKTDNFEQTYGSIVERDENDEPKFDSVYLHTKLKDVIPTEKISKELERQLNTGERNIENFEKSDFGKLFIVTQDKSDTYIVKELNNENAEKEAQRKAFNVLNTELRSILSEFGIEVGVLDEMEEKMGISGETNFEALKEMTANFKNLIRIAKGERGEQALPEEFAHFAIRALGIEHPLISRLLKALQSEKAQREVLGDDYERYAQEYNSNIQLLAEECAGKLVANHLIKGKSVTNNYKSIIERVIDAIKEFFARFDVNAFDNAIENANKYSSQIAEGILSRALTKEMSIKNIEHSSIKLFNIAANNAEKLSKQIENLIDIEKQRAILNKKVNSNHSKLVDKEAEGNITSLNLGISLNTQMLSMATYVESLCKSIPDYLNAADNYKNKNQWANVAKTFRELRNNVGAIKKMQEQFRTLLYEIKKDPDAEDYKEIIEKLESIMSDVNRAIDNFEPKYKEMAAAVWASLFEKYQDILPSLTLSEDYKKFAANIDFTKEAIQDISWFDRWLDSASDSRSEIIRIFDDIIKKHKEKARLKTIDFNKRVLAFAKRAQEAGIKNWEFAFKRNKDGKLVGKYLTEYDYDKFIQDKKEFFEQIDNTTFSSNPLINDILKRKEKKIWIEERTTNGVLDKNKPKASLYLDKQYQKLSLTEKKFLAEFLELKQELDGMLPENATSNNRCIMILKDNIERMKSSNSLSDVASIIKNAIKDSVVIRSDDTAFGVINGAIDFNGDIINSVPIFFTSIKESDDINDLSTDAISTLIAYSAMAYNYDSMNEVVDQLEVCRSYFSENAHTKVMQGDTQIESRNYIVGEQIITKLIKPQGNSYTIDRINDLFEMRLYNKMHKQGKVIKVLGQNVSVEKLGDTFNKMTALSVYALNFLGGVSNITTGIGMMNIEAFARDYFKPKDIAKADAFYAKHLPIFMGQINDNIKTSLLHLIDEKFNVMQDFEETTRNAKYNSSVRRLLSKSPLFMFNNAGEHWLQNRTALAVLAEYKVRRKDTGMTISLLDALTVKPIDKNKKYGAELSFDNIVNIDGSEFTNENISALSRRMKKINQDMHGIYNEDDRNAMQRHAIGRMAIMFRKWIVPSWNRRFSHGKFDYDLNDTREGYYRTTFNFIKALFSEANKSKSIIYIYKHLSEKERRNLSRALAETLQFILVSVGLGLLDLDTDDKSPWHKKMLEYQMRRLKLELGSQLPFTAPNEIFKILKSPAASLSTMQNYFNLIKLLWFPGWFGDENIIQTGRFKGWNENAKQLYMAAPILNVVSKDFNPTYGIPFLKQSGVIF